VSERSVCAAAREAAGADHAEVEEIARWWRQRYGDDSVRELMLKEALEVDGLELPEEKPEERARRQRLQAARER
jgi:hypothetical protein